MEPLDNQEALVQSKPLFRWIVFNIEPDGGNQTCSYVEKQFESRVVSKTRALSETFGTSEFWTKLRKKEFQVVMSAEVVKPPFVSSMDASLL